jgi:hypothetical protein
MKRSVCKVTRFMLREQYLCKNVRHLCGHIQKLIMGSFDQNSSYIPPFFAVFAQTLGQFPQNVGFCPDFLYIAHLGIPEIWAIARKDEFAQKLIFRCACLDSGRRDTNANICACVQH